MDDLAARYNNTKGETERARDALRHIDAGCARDEWVRIGMAAKSAGLLFNDFHDWSASAGNFASENDCRAVWKSFDDSGAVTPATLFRMAIAQGWKDPAKTRTKALNGSRPSATISKPSPSPQTPVKQAANANAVEVWERCIPATPAEAYIDRKQGKPDGLRVYPASAEPLKIGGVDMTGALVVPCYAPDGVTLQTLQFIPLAGDKKNLPLASFGEGFFAVGDIASAKKIYIVEGWGQSQAVTKADPASAAVVTFGASRTATVAKALRDKFPAARLVIVPDKGQEDKAAKIAADISGQWVAMPDDKPGNYDCNDFAQEHGTGALAALLQRPVAPAMRYALLSCADLCNAKPMRWMVRGVLPADGLAALFGSSGSGKSFLILDMACAVAGGDYEWFGRRVTQRPVTYVCLGGEAGTGKRIKAWSLRHNKPVPDALRFITQPFNLLSDDVPELAKAIIAGGGAGGMVIIDTLNRAAPGADENSSVDMGKLIFATKQLQSLTGGLVCLVHHCGKDATKKLRGHSSLYAALDGVIEVTSTNTRKAWSVDKSKDDVTGDAHPFKLDIVPVGIDDDGDEITSCVIAPDDSGEAFQRKKPLLGKNQKIACDVLGEPLRKSPHTGKDGAPAGRPCLDYTEALELVAVRMPTDAKHRKTSAKTAITGLVANGYMGMKGDWLWDNITG